MDILNIIHTRRSIRRFRDKPISENLITKILEAAMTAPSAHNQQPWHFIVIDDPELKNKIPEFHQYAQMTKDAPIGILVCGNTEKFVDENFWIQDCAAATENLLLAVHGLDLGAVWTGVYPKETIMNGFIELLNLPPNIIPFAFIPIGYTSLQSNYENRYNENNISHNKWSI